MPKDTFVHTTTTVTPSSTRLFLLAAALAALLVPFPATAQNIQEIMIGTIGDMPGDEFSCGRQGDKETCGLHYRYYCVDRPDEINGPAKPPSGNPRYKRRLKSYVPSAVHTGNFPEATRLGPGRTWNLVWDGVIDAGTPEHVGYYAASSQIVERNELGNPMTSTCLPVVGQYACFGQFGADKGAIIQNTPLGDLNPIGGLTPLPVPLLTRNGQEKVGLVWEQASAQESRDGAALPIEGYVLYAYPNPVSPPSEKELQDKAVRVTDLLPLTETSTEIPRDHEALEGAVTFTPVIKVVYTGGLESYYHSANGPATGLAYPDTAASAEIDDAAAGAGEVGSAIDIEHLFLEVRQKKNEQGADEPLLVATVDLLGQPAGKLLPDTTVRVFIDFNDEDLAGTFAEPGKKDTADITLSAELRRTEGEVRATFSGADGIADHSGLDKEFGRVVFAAPLDALLASVPAAKLRASDLGGGRRQVLVWAETRLKNDRDQVPNTNDGGGPTVAGEVVKFAF